MKYTLNLLPATSSECTRLDGKMIRITIHFPWKYGIFLQPSMENLDRLIDEKLTIQFLKKD